MQVKRFLLVQTGTYNDQYLRPYQAHLDGHTLAAYQEITNGDMRVTPVDLAPIAGTILSPASEAQSAITLPNGWGESRFRFILEIESGSDSPLMVGGNTLQIITGYTDHPGGTAGGAIDPNMRLYFNNSIVLRSMVHNTPTGPKMQYTVQDASHLLTSPAHLTAGAAAPMGGFHMPDVVTLMRPDDVLTHLQLAASMGEEVGNAGDLRGSTIGSAAFKSRRSNSMPGTHLSRCINALGTAAMGTHADPLQGSDPETTFTQARKYVREGMFRDDNFLSLLQDRTANYRYGRFVTMHELNSLFPSLGHVTTMIFNGGVQNRTPVGQRGDSSYWHSSTNEVRVANILGYSVPAIMMDLMLTKLTFVATNMTLDGSVQIRVDTALSFANVNLAPYIQRAIDRINTEIMPMITHGNQIGVNVMMAVDVAGETHIRVSYGGGPEELFVMPSFSDALFSPVVTMDVRNLATLAVDVNTLANATGINTAQFHQAPTPTYLMPGVPMAQQHQHSGESYVTPTPHATRGAI
jgi:hypothetical protein